jgi:hypothetical protein
VIRIGKHVGPNLGRTIAKHETGNGCVDIARKDDDPDGTEEAEEERRTDLL